MCQNLEWICVSCSSEPSKGIEPQAHRRAQIISYGVGDKLMKFGGSHYPTDANASIANSKPSQGHVGALSMNPSSNSEVAVANRPYS